MASPADIFDCAKGYVNNKGIAARIGHSAKLHSLRSAISSKGSASSKGLALAGAVFRATMGAIPIPVVGGLIGAAENYIEGKVRSHKRQGNLKAASTIDEKVKFELKELSVAELDRYRWKVVEAMETYNKTLTRFNESYAAKGADQQPCEALLELAMSVQQVVRRVDKLKAAVLSITAVTKLTTDWIAKCENGSVPAATGAGGPSAPTVPTSTSLTGSFNNVRETIRQAIEAEQNAINAAVNTLPANATSAEKDAKRTEYLATKHAKCDRWCCCRDGAKADEWVNFKDRSALVLRTLADPFGPGDFSNNCGSLWS